MKRQLTAIRSKVSSARYGNPGRGLTVMAVAGPFGKTTTGHYLAEILKEAGRSPMLITNDDDTKYDTSIDAFFRTLARAKRRRADLLILEVTERLLGLGVLQAIMLDTLILTEDSPHTEELMKLSPRHVVLPSTLPVRPQSVAPYQAITYGEDETAEARIDEIKLYTKGTEIRLTIDHQTKLRLATYLLGSANAYNAAAAATAAYVMALDLQAAREGVADLETVRGNFQPLDVDRPYRAVIDRATYELSFERVLSSAKQKTKRRLIAVLGDFQVSDEAIAIAARLADRLFVVGKDREVPSKVDLVESADEAVKKAARAAKQDDTLVLLGEAMTAEQNGESFAEHALKDNQ